MLLILDLLLTIIHLVVIIFNLLGWIWKRTRKLHLWCVFFTLVSWLLLGIKFGLGYCFLTDWHWDIKRALGQQNLPHSFIQYLFDQVGLAITPVVTDYITLITFILAIGMSLYLYFFKKQETITI